MATPAPIDDGFKRAATLISDWHKSGVMSKELWGSVSGTAYRGANEEFKNAQVPFYLSGSWQIAQFDKTVGNAFDWIAAPTPCGPANCSGMPGGAGVIGIKATKHPAEVAKVMDYLASEPILAEFYARTLFVPGHIGIAKKGVAYQGASPQAAAALKVFGDSVAALDPAAYRIQGNAYSRIVFNAAISRWGSRSRAKSASMKPTSASRRMSPSRWPSATRSDGPRGASPRFPPPEAENPWLRPKPRRAQRRAKPSLRASGRPFPACSIGRWRRYSACLAERAWPGCFSVRTSCFSGCSCSCPSASTSCCR